MSAMTRVGIVGCGVISNTYASTMQAFEHLDVMACADIVAEKAEQLAATHGIPRSCGIEELLADPDIEIVLNLTPASQHVAVNRAIIENGKSVFSEKPLATDLVDALDLVELAAKAKVRIGCAPDTFMGAGLQTARAALDSGLIGEPVGATAFMMGRGPERWHPNPGIFYERGAGPLYDMGPYYLTALIQLLGPARLVTAVGRTTYPTRTIGSGPHQGDAIAVEVPTHVSTTIEYDSGAIATLVTSFDVVATRHRFIEIYGSEGTLSVPDPNRFDGTVAFFRLGDTDWTPIELKAPTMPQQRGIGMADMGWAARTGRPHRASGTQAAHVVDLMASAITSSEKHVVVELATTCERPEPLPDHLAPNTFDD
jgi:predicted dehydrogenase